MKIPDMPLEPCSLCGGPLAVDTPDGLCPQCLPDGAPEEKVPTSALPDTLLGDAGGSESALTSSRWTPPSTEALAAQLPQFAVSALIGRGGMGAVYRGTQLSLQRPVAIKILPDSLSRVPGFAARFEREARILAGLQHPGIVHVHDFGATASGLLYFVMELVDGTSLRQLLPSLSGEDPTGTAASRADRDSRILSLFVQICEALHHAHGCDVLHRDIKPDNVLVSRDGRVKLADFGLARPLLDEGGAALTQPNVVMGTPHYMAPEMRNTGAIDSRADVYSLGVVLYEALTGRLPAGNWTAPSGLCGCDSRFDAIVSRALQQDPGLRYQTAGEMRDALLAMGISMAEGPPTASAPRTGGVSTTVVHQRRLGVLLFTDIVNSVDLQAKIGTESYLALLSIHDDMFRRAVASREGGRTLNHTGNGFLAVFDSGSAAVKAALRFQRDILTCEAFIAAGLSVRAGVHQGEIMEEVGGGGGPSPGVVGMAVNMAARVMSVALPGQILLTKAVFDDARLYVREHPPSDDGRPTPELTWLACGHYIFKGLDEPVDIFEVGAQGLAPAQPPPDTDKVQRHVDADEAETLGWRPSVGREIPGRAGWLIEQKLGEGGFGEVWLARHRRTREERVFKFCFDAERLRSFKREEKLFVVLRATLGDRPDIATLYETQRDRSPYFVESRYYPEGNLMQWAEKQGGLGQIPLQTRLDLFVETARAVAAAHSVGIIHKDLKPSNVLIRIDEHGKPRAVLSDFGIGVLADPSAADQLGLTGGGFTGTILADNASSRTGTRLYTAPEYLTGSPPSMQGDLYALGVMLFQLVVGSANRAVAQGWEADLEDDLLRQDVSDAVHGKADRRLQNAATLADRVAALEERHRAARARRRAVRRYRLLRAASILAVLAIGVFGLHLRQMKQEQAATRQALAAAELSRNAAQAREARLALDRGLALCDGREVATGLLWLARALELAPPDDTDLCSVIRTNLADWSNRTFQCHAALPHPGTTVACAWAPDGLSVVTAGSDGIARLWDRATWTQRLALQHKTAVNVIAFSPDGSLIATGSSPVHQPEGAMGQGKHGGAMLWSATSGEPIGKPLDHDVPVSAIAFSTDGEFLFTGDFTGILRRWSVKTGMLEQDTTPGEKADISAISIHPVEGHVLVALGSAAHLCHRGTLHPIWSITNKPAHGYRSAAFSPDGKLLALGDSFYATLLWNFPVSASHAASIPHAPDPEVSQLKLRHESWVWGLSFSSDGNSLLTGCRDGLVRLWDLTSPRAADGPIAAAMSKTSARAIAISPDGTMVVSGAENTWPRVWRVPAADQGEVIGDAGGPVSSIALSADEKTLLSATSDLRRAESVHVMGCRAWDVASRLPSMDAPLGQLELKGIGYLGDESMPLVADKEGWLHVWNMKARSTETLPLSADGVVSCMALHKATQTAALGFGVGFDDSGGALIIRIPQTWPRVKPTSWDDFALTTRVPEGEPPSGTIRSAAFNRDGGILITGSENRTVRLWHSVTGAAMSPLLRQRNAVWAVAFSPSDSHFASGDWGGVVQVWENAPGYPPGITLHLGGPVRGLAYLPGGKVLVATVMDNAQKYSENRPGMSGTLQFWHADLGVRLGPGKPHPGQGARALAVSKDGSSVFTGDSSGIVRRWQAPKAVASDPTLVRDWVRLITNMDSGASMNETAFEGQDWQDLWQRCAEQCRSAGLHAPKNGPEVPLSVWEILKDASAASLAEAKFEEFGKLEGARETWRLGVAACQWMRGKPSEAAASCRAFLASQYSPDSFEYLDLDGRIPAPAVLALRRAVAEAVRKDWPLVKKFANVWVRPGWVNYIPEWPMRLARWNQQFTPERVLAEMRQLVKDRAASDVPHGYERLYQRQLFANTGRWAATLGFDDVAEAVFSEGLALHEGSTNILYVRGLWRWVAQGQLKRAIDEDFAAIWAFHADEEKGIDAQRSLIYPAALWAADKRDDAVAKYREAMRVPRIKQGAAQAGFPGSTGTGGWPAAVRMAYDELVSAADAG